MEHIAEIPYGAYWSTPFAKWQGAFSALNSVEFAAHVAKRELATRSIPTTAFDFGVLGMTVPQRFSFYGLPWMMGLLGAPDVGGPTVSQACATGVRSIMTAAQEVATGNCAAALTVCADRTSNGPHIYYPNPAGPGGTGQAEDWVMDNFNFDPLGGHAMVKTAENVARKHQISTAEQHEVVLTRCEQYRQATDNERAFQKRYMTLPFEVPSHNYRKTATTLEGDEGITLSTQEGLARLKPVLPDGSVTFGGQTFPADGSAAMAITGPEQATELSRDPSIRIGICGFGLARVELAHMPEATIPAARRALDQAGIAIDKIDAIKTHNPFAVNDIVFARQTGADLASMNNFGCSLIWGHPQAPTGLRAIIELIEELVLRGGGNGLFTGCAAGDTAMATVVSVSNG